MAQRSNIVEYELVRLRVVLVGFLFAFVLLLAALWRIQVARGDTYEKDERRQSVRRVRLPGRRGRIYSRGGECLADNRPSYCVAIYVEEHRRRGKWKNTADHIEKLVAELARSIAVPPHITRKDIDAHIVHRRPLPLLAWRDVDEEVLARLSEHAASVPGVEIYAEAVRVYPFGSTLCQTLGYVGRHEQKISKDEPYHFYMPEMGGRAGIEQRYDGVLRGEGGGRLMRIDVSGFRHKDIGKREPKAGSDVLLSIDTRIQRLAERVLGEHPGAAVVIDPSTGDVLALVSAPAYDLNDFVPYLPTAVWKDHNSNPKRPLLNRAVAGVYPPGSTFKPIVCAAAIENKKATPATRFDCDGVFELGRASFNCFRRHAHGSLTMREAIKHSCNVYFYRLGLVCGPDTIHHMADALGLGHPTGVGLDSIERSGLIPNDAWKRAYRDDGWRSGDTCNFAIGQGFVGVTPLQMAMVTATLANGGTVYRPRLVQGIRPPGSEVFRSIPVHKIKNMNWSRQTVETIRGGMKDVIMAKDGTGRLARVPGLVAAGKTGTAEFGTKGQEHNRGWMIAFAPFDQPRYAVALLVEEAVSGGSTTAPLMKELLAGLFEITPGEGRG